jgi:hypothetical protein
MIVPFLVSLLQKSGRQKTGPLLGDAQRAGLECVVKFCPLEM